MQRRSPSNVPPSARAPRPTTSLQSVATALTALAVVLAPLAASAHDPSPREDRRAPRERDYRVPGDERYRGWEDPYAHEREWSTHLGLGGGFFAPWQGDAKHQEQLEVMAVSPSGHFRIGGEFVFREFETRMFDVDDVDVDAYQLNLVMHWVFIPGHFTPYVGGGLGLHANDVSKVDIERGNPALDVRDDLGLGYGIFGVLGLELPIDEHLAIFAEGRLALSYQVTGIDEDDSDTYTDYYNDGVDDVDAEDTGGASAVFGLRFTF
ncbi:MAG: hypothetical protein R3E88_05300 [Myxococcota bacterium]